MAPDFLGTYRGWANDADTQRQLARQAQQDAITNERNQLSLAALKRQEATQADLEKQLSTPQYKTLSAINPAYQEYQTAKAGAMGPAVPQEDIAKLQSMGPYERLNYGPARAVENNYLEPWQAANQGLSAAQEQISGSEPSKTLETQVQKTPYEIMGEFATRHPEMTDQVTKALDLRKMLETITPEGQARQKAMNELGMFGKGIETLKVLKKLGISIKDSLPLIKGMFPASMQSLLPENLDFTSEGNIDIPGVGMYITNPQTGDMQFLKAETEIRPIPSPDGTQSRQVLIDKRTGKELSEISPWAKVPSQVPKIQISGEPKDKKANEFKLRKEFLGLPEVKDYPTVESQLQRGLNALETAKAKGSKVAVDQTIITVLNKMLDPSSVVRESEYARTPQDMSVLSQIKGKWEKIKSGGAGLDNTEREALINMVRNFGEIASQNYENRSKEYRELAAAYDLEPSRVVSRGNALKQSLSSKSGQSASAATKKPLSAY